jgi:hypothetical protein
LQRTLFGMPIGRWHFARASLMCWAEPDFVIPPTSSEENKAL